VPAAAPRGTPAATTVPPVTPKAASDAESAPSPSSSTLGSGRALASAPAATFNIVFVTSEVAPYSKTGGLGDVCGSLPQALAARGHRVMVVSPLYNGLPAEAADTGVDMNLLGAPGVGFRHLRSPAGVDYVFVAHPAFDRPDGLYGGGAADLQWRFALLSLAGLEAPLVLDLPGGGGEAGKAGGKAGGSSSSLSKYGEDCVFVANDWHAAMVPVYLAGKFRPGGVYGDARCVLAIHNLRHQGVFAPGTFSSLHLPGPWYGALEFQYPPHQRMGSYEEEGRASELERKERGDREGAPGPAALAPAILVFFLTPAPLFLSPSQQSTPSREASPRLTASSPSPRDTRTRSLRRRAGGAWR